jgi:phosphatidylserine/phosphatidylglycerophosphate/cardiolipin synthase-like enzyme
VPLNRDGSDKQNREPTARGACRGIRWRSVGDAIVITGSSATAPFSLKVRRGEGMALLSMDWKQGTPPDDFVGFAIEFQAPGEAQFRALENMLAFLDANGKVVPGRTSSRLAPFQRFRWVHFPRDANLDGDFGYRVTPVFMDANDSLSYGDPQEAAVILGGDTYPGKLNVAFTRGFVSSQAFAERYEPIATLLPPNANQGLTFTATNPKTDEALDWMGFEARRAILAVLDEAIADEAAQVRAVAYDLNEPEIVSRLEKLGNRLRMIIDNSGSHGKPGSAEDEAEQRLAASAGAGNVKRQHMGGLQHNKTIVLDSPTNQIVVCGSTNFSWRALFVQSNNALVLRGKDAADAFSEAFEQYWQHDDPGAFSITAAAGLSDLKLNEIDAQVAFSPHSAQNALLAQVAEDIGQHTGSTLLYSLAFLYQTPGPILDAIKTVTEDDAVFVYGISDRKVGGIEVQRPNGNVDPVYPDELSAHVPEPFKSEVTGNGGIRMHHKFVVIDFDKPTARVYLGSYNFSHAADAANGENLLIIRDPRVAVSYAVEALTLFDHYHFRISAREATEEGKPYALARPPRKPDEKPWWDSYYSDPHKARDRKVFA